MGGFVSENPLDILGSIAGEYVARGDPRGAWLMRGLRLYVFDDEKSLDAVLGLSGRLGRSPRNEWLRRQRDHYLWQALQALDGNYGHLAENIRSYFHRKPAVDRAQMEPRQDWTKDMQAIHRAAHVCKKLPVTAKHLREILSDEPPPVPFFSDMRK